MFNRIIERANLINLFFYTLAFIFLGGIVFQLFIPLGGNDYWMHAGHVRYFSENILAPVTFYDESNAIRVRNFSPWQFLLANIKNIFDISTVQAMQIGSVISIGLVLVGLWLTSGILSKSPFAQTALLVTTLFVIGSGFSWSEEIHIHSILKTASYPSTVAVAIGFMCFYFTHKYLNQSSVKLGFAIVLTVALMLLIHQMVFLHFMSFLFFWVMFMQVDWKQRFIVFGIFSVGLIVVVLWPYFNPLEVAYSAVTEGDSRRDGTFTAERLKLTETHRVVFFGVENFIKALGIAISSYILMFFVKGRIRWPLLVFALFCTLMWQIGTDLRLPTSGYRWALPTIFALQFIYAHHLGLAFEKVLTIQPCIKKSYIFSCFLIAATVLVLLQNLRSEMWMVLPQIAKDEPKNFSEVQDFMALKNKLSLSPETVVLADHRISYSLVGMDLTPVIYSRKYNSINTNLIDLYNNELSVKKQKDLVKQLKVDVLILDTTKHSEDLFKSVGTYANKINQYGRFVAFRVERP